MTTPETPPIALTVIGLGAMGEQLAATWIEAGHHVTVWNRSPQKADALVARGAVRADGVLDAITASQLIVVCVLDNAATRELLEPVAEHLDGRVLVNLTTGTPGEARDLGAWASDHGVAYLDGVIMAVPAMIGAPEAMILYGGSQTAFDAHQATLNTVGPHSPFLGTDAGLPALYDVGMLSLLYATFTGWLQAFALVDSGNVPATTFLPYLQEWFVNVVAGIDATDLAAQVDAGVYPDTLQSSLAINDAGLKLLVRAHEEAGVDSSLLAAISAFAARRAADGHGTDGYATVIEAIKRPAAA